MKQNMIKKIICLPIIALVATSVIIGNVIANFYSSEINSLLCPPIHDNEELNRQQEEGQKLSKQIIQEGAVLVKNDNNTLPLNKEKNRKVNVFGHSCVDWGFGGSGSGRVRPENDDFSTTIDLLKALKRYGIDYNTELVNMYKEFRGIGRIEEAQDRGMYALYEPSIKDKKYYSDTLLNNAKDYSSTAIVTITRFGSEGVDHTLKNGDSRSDLQISLEEEELLKYVGENYDNVIVLINSANTMELGFLQTISGLDACMVIGLTGTQGVSSLPKLLYGENSPSGKLVDTYAYSFESNIAYNYYNQAAWYQPYGFYDYIEGIYVGYKWYETAYIENYWNNIQNEYGNGYDGVVQYPFGYGLSYTNFKWSLEEMKINNTENNIINEESVISFKINVENIGDVAGQDVVEFYLTSPYTKNGIEKSYVNLIGFEKTEILSPKMSQTLEFNFNVRDFASYDCYDKNNNNHVGYELDKGTYSLKLMTDAHNLKNCEENTFDFEIKDTINLLNDKYSNEEVTNRLTGDSSLDGASIDGNDDGNVMVNYISRGSFPQLNELASPSNRTLSDKQLKASKYSRQEAEEWDNAKVDKFNNKIHDEKVTWNKNNNLSITDNNGNITELGYELGQDYNNEKWNDLLDQLSIDEVINMVSNGYASSKELNSIGKPKLFDYDGPMQIKGFTGKPRGTGYPSEPVLGQTWNKQLAKNYGLSFGKEMNALGVNGLYGFGCNIHRSPINGRNFEYFSEDGYLSGIMLTNAIIGIQNTGRYAYIKHLAVNNGEARRVGAFTWCTEQALREIYLKPFQMAIQEGDCVALMTSYNRIGANWTGGSTGLIEGIVRKEWGFKGAIITDCAGADNADYMNMDEALRVGGDLGMETPLNASKSGYTLNYSLTSSNRLQYQLREAAHHVTYTYLRVQYQNDLYNKSNKNNSITSSYSIESWAWWKVILVDLDILISFACLIWLYFLFREDILKLINKGEKNNENV